MERDEEFILLEEEGQHVLDLPDSTYLGVLQHWVVDRQVDSIEDHQTTLSRGVSQHLDWQVTVPERVHLLQDTPGKPLYHSVVHAQYNGVFSLADF